MTNDIVCRLKKRHLYICFLIFCTPLQLFSQSLSFKNFNVDDGLPSSTIYTAFQDKRGFMWFASDLGVSKYDGYSFTNYSSVDGLPDNEVFNFFEDTYGRIWFQTLNGNIAYQRDGVIFNAETDTTLQRLNAKSSVCGMYEDEGGTVWICTFKDGIFAYSKEKHIKRFFHDGRFDVINSFVARGDHNFFLVTRYGLYDVTLDEDKQVVVKLSKVTFPLDETLSYSKNIALSKDFILFNDRGTVYSADLKKNEFGYFMNEKSDSVVIYNLTQDDKYVWVCTNSGALRFSKQDRKLVDLVLKEYKVSSVIKDREGNYWVTTLGDGVFFCSFEGMYSYTVRDGLKSNKVLCIQKDSANRIWVGYEKGTVNTIDHGKIYATAITHKRFSNSCRVRKMHSFGKRMWFATTVGLYALEDGQIEFLSSNARDILEYEKNQLMIGNSERLFAIDRKTFNKFNNTLSTDPDHYRIGLGNHGILRRERSKALFKDSESTVWISTEARLYKRRDGVLENISPDKFNEKLYVNDFDEMPDKTILMATSGHGLYLYDKKGNYKRVDVRDGLSSGICNAVAADGNTIWLATNKGLNKISGYPNELKIEYLNLFDGLLSNEATDVLISNDTVWVATKNGINFFYKDYLHKPSVKPQIYIESMIVHGKLIDKEKPSAQHNFGHDENDIRINFLCPLFNSIGAIVYRYKLHRDAQWEYTKSPFVYFSELQSGNYEFVVEAKGRQGIWSNEASISFVVNKPFYARNLFIAAVVLTISFIAAFAVKMYIASQKSKADMKQRVVVSELQTLRAQMNPHFLFNALNSIQDLFLNNDAKTAQHYIGKFGKLMRSLLNHSNTGSITIAEEMATITDYLEIEQLRMNHRFKYSIEIDPAIDVHTVEMPSMIIQPFIENSIWHGFTDEVVDAQLNIKLTLDGDDYVVISLVDNGIGRKKAGGLRKKTHHSKGIHLIMERIDILNFGNLKKISLSIHDLEDAHGNHPGTMVNIRIPLAV